MSASGLLAFIKKFSAKSRLWQVRTHTQTRQYLIMQNGVVEKTTMNKSALFINKTHPDPKSIPQITFAADCWLCADSGASPDCVFSDAREFVCSVITFFLPRSLLLLPLFCRSWPLSELAYEQKEEEFRASIVAVLLFDTFLPYSFVASMTKRTRQSRWLCRTPAMNTGETNDQLPTINDVQTN